MERNIAILNEWIQDSNNIVFFGGAGTSTECGIPDFRSADGLYSKKKYGYEPEVIISHDFFIHNPEIFYKYYKDAFIYENAVPNEMYFRLADLENKGKLKAIITQNVDGLHKMAGSKTVFELHGSIYENHCLNCGKEYPLKTIISCKGIPHCDECGGVIKPDVVLYGESLDYPTIEGAVNAISSCEVLIVGGTSLNVYPAAGLINYYQGNKLVLINKSTTPYDNSADLIINLPINEVFKQIK